MFRDRANPESFVPRSPPRLIVDIEDAPQANPSPPRNARAGPAIADEPPAPRPAAPSEETAPAPPPRG
jgi:hypothetical protein